MEVEPTVSTGYTGSIEEMGETAKEYINLQESSRSLDQFDAADRRHFCIAFISSRQYTSA